VRRPVDRYEELIQKRDRAGLNAEEAAELGRLLADRRGETRSLQAPPTVRYRSLRTLGTVLAWLLGVAVALDLVAALSDLAEIRLVDRLAAGRAVTIEEATASDTRQRAIGLIQFGTSIVTGVVFIVWLYRAYSNLLALGAVRLRFARGWAIGGWFVPIWGLFRPKQIVNDAWRGSEPALPASYEDVWARPVPPWWQAWWLSFLSAYWLALAALRVTVRGDTLEEFRRGSLLIFWSDLLSGVAGIVAIFVVRAITRRQEERAAMLFSVPPPPHLA
jgi:hypothetical protein